MRTTVNVNAFARFSIHRYPPAPHTHPHTHTLGQVHAKQYEQTRLLSTVHVPKTTYRSHNTHGTYLQRQSEICMVLSVRQLHSGPSTKSCRSPGPWTACSSAVSILSATDTSIKRKKHTKKKSDIIVNAANIHFI